MCVFKNLTCAFNKTQYFDENFEGPKSQKEGVVLVSRLSNSATCLALDLIEKTHRPGNIYCAFVEYVIHLYLICLVFGGIKKIINVTEVTFDKSVSKKKKNV